VLNHNRKCTSGGHGEQDVGQQCQCVCVGQATRGAGDSGPAVNQLVSQSLRLGLHIAELERKGKIRTYDLRKARSGELCTGLGVFQTKLRSYMAK